MSLKAGGWKKGITGGEVVEAGWESVKVVEQVQTGRS